MVEELRVRQRQVTQRFSKGFTRTVSTFARTPTRLPDVPNVRSTDSSSHLTARTHTRTPTDRMLVCTDTRETRKMIPTSINSKYSISAERGTALPHLNACPLPEESLTRSAISSFRRNCAFPQKVGESGLLKRDYTRSARYMHEEAFAFRKRAMQRDFRFTNISQLRRLSTIVPILLDNTQSVLSCIEYSTVFEHIILRVCNVVLIIIQR